MVMSRVQRKIEDRSGASLSVALLFFLVCAIVGSVLIAAASVSMGRMKNIADGEQERYALDSAMEMLAEEMQGGEITLTASMDSAIQVRENSTDDDDDSEDNEDEERNNNDDDDDANNYIPGVIDKDNFEPWKLSQISIQYDTINPEPTSELVKLRNDTAKGIFTHYMNIQSGDILSAGGSYDSNTSVLGIWYPSENDLIKLCDKLSEENADNDFDLNRFFFLPPGNNSSWDVDGKSYQYISAHGTELTEDPIVLSL